MASLAALETACMELAAATGGGLSAAARGKMSLKGVGRPACDMLYACDVLVEFDLICTSVPAILHVQQRMLLLRLRRVEVLQGKAGETKNPELHKVMRR